MKDIKRNIKLGEFVAISTKNGSAMGILRASYSFINKDEKEEKIYKISIGEHILDIFEYEILDIVTLDDIQKKEDEYLADIEKKHDIKCFDADGKRLASSVIIANMIDDYAWDELTEDEKKIFLKIINLSIEDITEIINVLLDYKYDNEDMHDKRIKALDKGIKAIQVYNDIIEKIPLGKTEYKFLYEQMKIEDLVNSI